MKGQIVSVFGNMVIAETNGHVVKNSVGYCNRSDGARLLCEVIRVRGKMADLCAFCWTFPPFVCTLVYHP